jgi:hypothetical protein
VSCAPVTAGWRHAGAQEGFEVVTLHGYPEGHRIIGQVAAVEEDTAFALRYAIEVDPSWRTRSARVESLTAVRRLEADGRGSWRLDGEPAPHLDGCLDVDLEASAATNTLAVHRLALAAGEAGESRAAWVRSVELCAEVLEQRYARLTDGDDARRRYDYAAPALDFTALLVFGDDGLVVDYPGLAARAG